MKILLINKFLYPKGGAEVSTLNTEKLLTAKRHKVIFWGMDHPENPDYPYMELFVSFVDYNRRNGIFKSFKAAVNLLYSFEAKNRIEKLLDIEKPDIVHLNNFAHQISPSILDVFAKCNIPTVMTMRDCKLVCPTYLMLLDGEPCERCKDGKYYWCFLKNCTKSSYSKSLLNAMEMYLHHKILHIYDKIDLFISPSMFLKEKIEEMGFKGKIFHLPNFLELDDFFPCYEAKENSIVYVGRLSQEKGLATMLEAVKGLAVKLKIIGDGPLKASLKFKVKSEKLDNVELLGYKSGDDLKNEVRNSIALIIPSECYENNPRVVLEAFALGKPVIGSRIGGIPELVKDSETGYTFTPGNALNLRYKIEYLLKNPDSAVEMGKNGRRFVEKELNTEEHYRKLMEIYQMALERH
ncbi:MAG: glycosyltransferase family 4 protein [Deltaproteobacteria bacterium]|nr:glycosyltransferase family 4 protein [Deltaproteobacteria bacterium]